MARRKTRRYEVRTVGPKPRVYQLEAENEEDAKDIVRSVFESRQEHPKRVIKAREVSK
jgi:hypothetical protein